MRTGSEYGYASRVAEMHRRQGDYVERVRKKLGRVNDRAAECQRQAEKCLTKISIAGDADLFVKTQTYLADKHGVGVNTIVAVREGVRRGPR